LAILALGACGSSDDDVVSAESDASTTGSVSTSETTTASETTTVPSSSQPTIEEIAALDYELTVCLGPGASDADYQALEEILNRPTGVGTQVELPSGVEGVSFASGPGRVIIYMEQSATTADLDALAADLMSSPNVAGLVAGQECSP
jgi:hypothetical protein